MSFEYDAVTDTALDACDADFDDADFRRMAMACLDQGGLTQRDLDRVAAILEAAFPEPKVCQVSAFIAECAAECVRVAS